MLRICNRVGAVFTLLLSVRVLSRLWRWTSICEFFVFPFWIGAFAFINGFDFLMFGSVVDK